VTVEDPVVGWFDSHCHLQDEFGAPAGEGPVEPHADRLAATLARAAEAGVTRLVCVGTGAASSAEAVALARSLRRPGGPAAAEGVALWATVGLHPHDAVDGVDSLGPVLESELGPGGDGSYRVVVGIGECGLDYHYDHSPRPVQREAFARQVDLARHHGLALVVHTREAWDDTVDILGAVGAPDHTVIHCFTGGPDEARRCLDLGAYLSFSGVVTFANAADVREAAALCPADRLLVETDSPFLTPVPHRGSPNEPARVPLVGAAVAHASGVTAAEVAGRSTANARRVFGV
jgi:TatD DNase family protein